MKRQLRTVEATQLDKQLVNRKQVKDKNQMVEQDYKKRAQLEDKLLDSDYSVTKEDLM